MTARASRSDIVAACAGTGRIARGAAMTRGERLVTDAITARPAAATADTKTLFILLQPKVPTESIGIYTRDGNPLFTPVMARFDNAPMRTTWGVLLAILAGFVQAPAPAPAPAPQKPIVPVAASTISANLD